MTRPPARDRLDPRLHLLGRAGSFRLLLPASLCREVVAPPAVPSAPISWHGQAVAVTNLVQLLGGSGTAPVSVIYGEAEQEAMVAFSLSAIERLHRIEPVQLRPLPPLSTGLTALFDAVVRLDEGPILYRVALRPDIRQLAQGMVEWLAAIRKKARGRNGAKHGNR